ncbi:MAG: GNAT family N-acetyltransferase [Acidimicrobiia bacterium]|nr:GNAT family N-acetyltransferase [Acidimicrobiia bacterium]
MMIEPMQSSDWPEVAHIYTEGIATGNATFEVEAPSWADWDAGHLQEGRIVARSPGRIDGWAALSPVSDRCAYGGVAEVSVYVAVEAQTRGIGRALLERLITESERAGIWMLQAGIFPENRASIALHQTCGFRIVGTRERLGQMNGRWRDVTLLERRSAVVGV